jgi:hypothetical protein
MSPPVKRVRERIALQQTVEAYPRHAGLVGAAIKPLPPKPPHLVVKAGEGTRVA